MRTPFIGLLLLILSLHVSSLDSVHNERLPLQMNEFQPKEISKQRSPSWDLKMIHLPEALGYFNPSLPVVIAVIDTGIDINHPALKDFLWVNPGETGLDAQGRDKATNQIDDDKNGFVDDVHGWNFAGHNNHVDDEHGHGSHVSGIITRIAPHVKIMALKYYDEQSDGGLHLLNTIRAINYATQMGAKIINYSAGGLSQNAQEKLAIERAARKNILFVAAAGNEASNSDISGYYPANYPIDNIISVTAVNSEQRILSSSNYSDTQVDISAPGENIYSTLPNGLYGYLTGTSQATAFVTGVAALLYQQKPELMIPQNMIDHLVRTGSVNEKLLHKVRYKSQLNAYLALTKENGSLQSAESVQFEAAHLLKSLPVDSEPIVIQRAPSGRF
ncbi:MAG: S8 family serine peptidase [Bdellovibrionales bacterium]|nr:S8 family serine peptidase [Bdellovibrionales bacterium]